MQKLAAIALVAAALIACHQPSSKEGEPTDDVVARLGAVEITTAQVDARILALPATERPKPGQDLDAWYEEQIRELAIEHQLRAEAEATALSTDEAFLTARRGAEKQLAVQLCLADLRPEIEQITEDDLRNAYEARSESFSAPERRAAYHLFLRHAPGNSTEAARAEIEALRDQVLGGESFTRLAAVHSDSESRHREGALGWVIPGQLPGGFGDVIFDLEEGVPSEPVTTRDGFHLFYVDQILPARHITLDEARSGLQARLVAERQGAVLTELEAEIKPPPKAVLLDRPAFLSLVSAGDPDAVVLSLGDLELTLADLRRHLRQALAQPSANERGAPPAQLAWQQLEHLRRRELIYLHCQASGKIPTAELETKLANWQQQTLLAAQRQRRLIAIAGRDEGRLRLFYDNNIGNFSKPPTWHLRRLRISLADNARAVMARLEDAAVQGEPKLTTLHAELGGEIDDLGVKNLAELRRLEPKLPPLIAPLTIGKLSPPYRTAKTLDIVELVAREEAEPLPFAEIRERVAAAYVEQYTREVYRELSDDILQTAELQILPEGLAALREAGLPQPDISVEQLEELLEGL